MCSSEFTSSLPTLFLGDLPGQRLTIAPRCSSHIGSRLTFMSSDKFNTNHAIMQYE